MYAQTLASIHTPYSIYGYVPTEWIAALFIGLFGLFTVIHVAQGFRYRLWWIFPTAVTCGITELLGWSARMWSSKNVFLLTPYLMQISTLGLAPTFFVAANFIILGKIIVLLGRQYSRIPPMLYTVIFCSVDVLALTIQGVGGGLASAAAAQEEDPVHQGQIMLSGISFQLASIIVYVAFATEFFTRWALDRPIRKAMTEKVDGTEGGFFNAQGGEVVGSPFTDRTAVDGRRHLSLRIKLMITGLAFSTTCILIRSIYRVIELSDGWTGRIIQTQVYFNVLDATMLVLAMFCLNLLHPGVLLKETGPLSKRSSQSSK